MKTNPSPTIHVEGLDLAGKSTVCRLLAARLGAEHRHNSILAENPVHAAADSLRTRDLLETGPLGWVFYGALLYDLAYYAPPDGPVVQDSTVLLRSIAFHEVFGDKAVAEKFRTLLPRHPRFTRSFVLTASDAVRLKRLEGRCSRHNDSPEDYLIRRDPDGFHRMERLLMDLAAEHFGAEVIDSSNLEREGGKEEVVGLILEKSHVH